MITETGALILFVFGVLSIFGLLVRTREHSEPPKFPPEDPWKDQAKWQKYLHILEQDGMDQAHLEILRREGPEVFCQKLRQAVVRGSGNTLRPEDVKCPFDQE